MAAQSNGTPVSISPLLLKLANPTTTLHSIPAGEIATAVSLIFNQGLSPVQTGCLLWALHTTQLDRRPDILAACANSMREAAAQVNNDELHKVVKARARPEGAYQGGLCDIVGTGGDSHNTYNVSTTSSIIASPLLMIAKHGNNASTSKSGSADLLLAAQPAPVIASTTASTLPEIYSRTNYAFLYAREWHPGMKHAAAVRKELPFRTIFNLLGPLANPVHNSSLIEARILGVAKRDMGPVFADALRLSGARKALVVCGEEDLDEISCAGPSYCWLLREAASADVEIVPFVVAPEDFGLRRHALATVAGGKSPEQNAAILGRILAGEVDVEGDDPILTFVLLNTAALIAVSGVCEAEESEIVPGEVVAERGPGGLRWKEGVRRAKWCMASGAARRQWEGFVEVTNEIEKRGA